MTPILPAGKKTQKGKFTDVHSLPPPGGSKGDGERWRRGRRKCRRRSSELNWTVGQFRLQSLLVHYLTCPGRRRDIKEGKERCGGKKGSPGAYKPNPKSVKFLTTACETTRPTLHTFGASENKMLARVQLNHAKAL